MSKLRIHRQTTNQPTTTCITCWPQPGLGLTSHKATCTPNNGLGVWLLKITKTQKPVKNDYSVMHASFSLLCFYFFSSHDTYMYDYTPSLTGLSAARVDSWSSGNWKHFLSGSMELVSTDSLSKGITLKVTSTQWFRELGTCTYM